MEWVHGPEARKSSQIAIKMVKRLLKSGFGKDASIDLINSTISLNTKEDMYSTLDISVFDLYSGNIEMVKNGACPTFIKTKEDVQMIKSVSLPAGIVDNIDTIIYDKDLQDGDIIVMCSDGIIESTSEYEQKEDWVKNILEELYTDNPQKIADIILKEAVDNSFGIAKDDMTIIVGKIKRI